MGRSFDTDVAIIGAGAAGIAAGRWLRARGRDCVILEARRRPGGRAWTESRSLGVPFDRGCAWLHDAERNPLRHPAAAAGLGVRSELPVRFHADGRFVDVAEGKAIQACIEAAFAALARAGRAGPDRAAAERLPTDRPEWPYLRYLLAAITAVEPEHYSTGDAAEEDAFGTNWLVRRGLGRLIAGRFARGLPICCACPVREVDHSGPAVRLRTDAGTLRARAAIVTASTGVLAGGAPRFRPPLPAWKRDALARVPMGCAEKIGLRFDGDPFGLPDDTFLHIRRGDTVLGFHLRPLGQPLAIAYAGGALGREVAALGRQDATTLALDYLAHAFGETLRRRVRRATVTNWLADPWARGSYSAAVPGGHNQRRQLARPVTPRLVFAGEATLHDAFATAHGAWLSGERAAAAVLA